MSIKVLENPSMFAGVVARVAANGNGLIALVGGSDALQALCAINEIAMHTSEQRGTFTRYVRTSTQQGRPVFNLNWESRRTRRCHLLAVRFLDAPSTGQSQAEACGEKDSTCGQLSGHVKNSAAPFREAREHPSSDHPLPSSYSDEMTTSLPLKRKKETSSADGNMLNSSKVSARNACSSVPSGACFSLDDREWTSTIFTGDAFKAIGIFRTEQDDEMRGTEIDSMPHGLEEHEKHLARGNMVLQPSSAWLLLNPLHC